jgi:hypothetical protein
VLAADRIIESCQSNQTDLPRIRAEGVLSDRLGMMASSRFHDGARPGENGRLRRGVLKALPGLFYAAAVLALFGGIAVDHLPDSPALRLSLVFAGAGVLVLAAVWLDRHDSRGE